MTGVPPGRGMGLTQFEVSRALHRAGPRTMCAIKLTLPGGGLGPDQVKRWLV